MEPLDRLLALTFRFSQLATVSTGWLSAAARLTERRKSSVLDQRCRAADGLPLPIQIRAHKRGNSLRAIAAELAARGYVNANGREFSEASMLGA